MHERANIRIHSLGSNCQRQQSFNGVGTAVKTMPQSNKDFRRIVKAIFSRSRFWADGILCHFVDLSLRSYLLSPVLVDLLMFLHKIYHERSHKSFTKLRWVRLVGSIANYFLDLFALDLKIQGGSNTKDYDAALWTFYCPYQGLSKKLWNDKQVWCLLLPQA